MICADYARCPVCHPAERRCDDEPCGCVPLNSAADLRCDECGGTRLPYDPQSATFDEPPLPLDQACL